MASASTPSRRSPRRASRRGALTPVCCCPAENPVHESTRVLTPTRTPQPASRRMISTRGTVSPSRSAVRYPSFTLVPHACTVLTRSLPQSACTLELSLARVSSLGRVLTRSLSLPQPSDPATSTGSLKLRSLLVPSLARFQQLFVLRPFYFAYHTFAPRRIASGLINVTRERCVFRSLSPITSARLPSSHVATAMETAASCTHRRAQIAAPSSEPRRGLFTSVPACSQAAELR